VPLQCGDCVQFLCRRDVEVDHVLEPGLPPEPL
jgi:hypothetical protein